MTDALALLLLRIEFAATAAYHYLFVPLTIGLMLLIGIMESIYLLRSNPAWRNAARFWGQFFFLGWCVGVLSGFPLRWQLTHNWDRYTRYAEAVLGNVLSLEMYISPFMLVLTGAFVFGWDRLPRYVHWCVTCALLLLLSVQTYTILVVHAWMQHPAGVQFGATGVTVTSLRDILLSPVALTRTMHVLSSAFVTGSVFVFAICAWYRLQGRVSEIVSRSLPVAAVVGLLATLAVIYSGHHCAKDVADRQPMKFASFEALWSTAPAPAPLTVFAIPSSDDRTNRYALKIPYLLSVLGTHSLDGAPPGIQELEPEVRQRVQQARFEADRIGAPDPGSGSTPAGAAKDGRNGMAVSFVAGDESVIPDVPLMFTSFRVMVFSGFLVLLLFGVAVFRSRSASDLSRRFLWTAVLCLPIPWIASLAGWIVAEVGRQPWVIYNVLPTALAATMPDAAASITALPCFAAAYTLLTVWYVYANLMCLRLGPETTVLAKIFPWRSVPAVLRRRRRGIRLSRDGAG